MNKTRIRKLTIPHIEGLLNKTQYVPEVLIDGQWKTLLGCYNSQNEVCAVITEEAAINTDKRKWFPKAKELKCVWYQCNFQKDAEEIIDYYHHPHFEEPREEDIIEYPPHQ